jgi:catechol 2,3-dioxygenase-like lactoylglutathione lyase family enzyme
VTTRTRGESAQADANIATAATHIRIARPTSQLPELIEFYCDGLGLDRIDGFRNHQGFSGVMIGLPGTDLHMEFTSHKDELEELVGQAPTQDNLLVFYLPDSATCDRIADRMAAAGHLTVEPVNPYWADAKALTYQDPDGWRVVVVPTPYS